MSPLGCGVVVACTFALGAAAASLSACSMPRLPSRGEDVADEAAEDAAPAVTYAEMRLSPRGTSSGLEHDLEPMREASADDKLFFEGTAENIDLDRRAELRAFEGAPPVIPHAVRQNSAPECLACHGARLQFRGRAARPICHDEHTNCTACHVTANPPVPAAGELGADPRAAANTFVGLRHQLDRPQPTAGAPPIAHQTAMRERCAGCHGQDGPGAGHHPVDFELTRTLPAEFTLSALGRLTCRTCHEPSRDLPALELVRTAPPSAGLPAGADLCRACHASAHEPVFARLGLSGGAHPGGADLDRVLSARMGARSSGCLGCHGTDGALTQGVYRDLGDARACAVCHREKAAGGRNHPVAVPPVSKARVPADLPVGDEGGPTCVSCHDLGAGSGDALLRDLDGGRALCGACHDEQHDAMEAAHGKVGAGRGEPCLGCHRVHGASTTSHLLATTSRASGADPTGCLACHGAGGPAATPDAAPGRAGHPVDGRHHDGLDGALTCTACHDAHAPDASTIECTSCHEQRKADIARGGHGDATCTDCHPVHRDFASADIPDVNPSAQRCLACHDAKLGKAGVDRVEAYQHPAPVFTPGGERWEPLGTLPLFGPNGRPVTASSNGDLTCQTCHTVHGPDATHATDHLRRPGWQAVCSACHGDQSILVYQYFHDREKIEGASP